MEIKAESAVQLAMGISQMTEGGASSKEQRDLVLQKIKKAFPEIFDNTGADPGKKVEIEFTKREIRAIAHGCIDMMDRDNLMQNIRGQKTFISGASGEIYAFFKKIAKDLKIWNYISKHIKVDSAPEFDGELDDEPEIVDQETE